MQELTESIKKVRKKGSGGSRPGAGRKMPATKITVNFSIDKTVIKTAKKTFKGKLSSMIEAYLRKEIGLN